MSEHAPKASKEAKVGHAADAGLAQRRKDISNWLLTRGFGTAAAGIGLVGAGILTAGIAWVPTFLVGGGAIALGMGASLGAAGIGKRIIDSFRGGGGHSDGGGH